MTEQPHTPKTDDIGARARTAVGWRALSQFSSQGISIVTGIILARLLMPADFGVIGMAGIVTGLAGVFQDLGFGQALVQRAELRPEHSRSAFWMTLIMGGLLYAALYFGAPFAGEYFHDERMVPVLRLMALSFLISPFGVVPRSLLQRDLDFRRPFYAGLAGTITSGAVGITLALLGHAYWSLVWALLASSIVGTIALCIVTRYTPPVVPTLSGARDLFGFGAGMTAISLMFYLRERADYIVIGRRLDASALGLYTRAFNIMQLPVNTAVYTIHGILFAALARLGGEPERMRHALARSLTALAAVVLPAEGLLLVASAELVPAVFGDQWVGAVPSLQVLALTAVSMVMGNVGGAAIKAVGRVDLAVWMQGTEAVLLPAAAYAGSKWGIVGVAAGVTLVHTAMVPVRMAFVHRATGFPARAFIGALRGPVLVTLGACLFGVAFRHAAIHFDMPRWSVLMVTIGAFAAAVALGYALSPFAETRTVLGDLSGHFLDRIARARPHRRAASR